MVYKVETGSVNYYSCKTAKNWPRVYECQIALITCLRLNQRCGGYYNVYNVWQGADAEQGEQRDTVKSGRHDTTTTQI